MVCTSSGIVGATGLEREVGTRKLTDVRQRSLVGPLRARRTNAASRVNERPAPWLGLLELLRGPPLGIPSVPFLHHPVTDTLHGHSADSGDQL
jgi:hypothetical protein